MDTLLDNGIRGQPMMDGHNKIYKSFLDVIKDSRLTYACVNRDL